MTCKAKIFTLYLFIEKKKLPTPTLDGHKVIDKFLTYSFLIVSTI